MKDSIFDQIYEKQIYLVLYFEGLKKEKEKKMHIYIK